MSSSTAGSGAVFVILSVDKTLPVMDLWGQVVQSGRKYTVNLNKRPDEPGQVDTGRARSLQELAELYKRYKQLTWCSSAKDQKERANLDIRIMKLYSTLFPHSSHAWHEDFEVVLRSARLASRAAARRQVAATNENS